MQSIKKKYLDRDHKNKLKYSKIQNWNNETKHYIYKQKKVDNKKQSERF